MKKLTTAVGISIILTIAISAIGCNKGQDGAVLAKVNRGAITAADFKQQLAELTPQMQQAVVSDSKARKEFLEDLIGIELVIQEARRQGLDKDAEFKKRQETLKKEMEKRIQDEVKNELFNNVLKKELGEKMSKVPEPTAKEVSEYYNKNKEKIRTAAGKQISLKDIEPQLKSRLMQEKRRELYLEFAKGLKAKATISVDDKALDAAMTALAQPAVDLSGMQATKVPPPAKKETAK